MEPIDVSSVSEATDSSFCLDDELEESDKDGNVDNHSMDTWDSQQVTDGDHELQHDIDLLVSSNESLSDDEIWDFSDSKNKENREENSSVNANALIRVLWIIPSYSSFIRKGYGSSVGFLEHCFHLCVHSYPCSMNWHPNFLDQFMKYENISNMKMSTLFMLSVLDVKHYTISRIA